MVSYLCVHCRGGARGSLFRMPWIFRKRHRGTQSTTDESVAWLLPFRQPAGTTKRSFGERATTATTATAAAANCCSYLFWPARIAYGCGSGAVCGSQRFWPRTTTIHFYCTFLIMKITISAEDFGEPGIG